MSLHEQEHYEESIHEYKQESEAMKAANRLPSYTRKFHEIDAIGVLLGDLSKAFSGKGIDYQREFSANTRTALAKELNVDELNFQYGRKE